MAPRWRNACPRTEARAAAKRRGRGAGQGQRQVARRAAEPSEGSAAACVDAKDALRAALVGTSRGAKASVDQRGVIEEAQANLEGSGRAIDCGALVGKWKLVYTTSVDLLPIFWFGFTNLTEVGDIYQCYEPAVDGSGEVRNIIEFDGVFPFLERARLTVRAKYTVCSPRRIALAFEEAMLDNVDLNRLGKSIVAPSILPRGFLNMRLLQMVQKIDLKVPLQNPLSTSLRESFGNPSLLLTYLDEDMFIGRAIPGSGVYILERVSGEGPEEE